MNILSDSQFTKEQIEDVFELTDTIRAISKSKEGLLNLKSSLPFKRAILYFTQSSTRTFLSFQSACQILGMDVMEIRNPEVSSEMKGESLEDSVRTFSSYADLIIMRSKLKGFCQKMALLLEKTPRPVPIINAGSGSDEHPTQALLDIYTFNKWFKSCGTVMQNKTFCFIGDLKRGRTVRSLVRLLSLFENINLVFVSPSEYKIKKDLQDFLKQKNISYSETEDMVSGIKKADCLYITRIQDEYKENIPKVNIEKFCFNSRHLKYIKKTCGIAHPFPRRMELENAVDFDPRALYFRQQRNGMWIRVSLILKIFGIDRKFKAENSKF